MSDVDTTFHFIDLDQSGVVTPVEFSLLDDFDFKTCLKDLEQVGEQLLQRYGSIDDAFSAFAGKRAKKITRDTFERRFLELRFRSKVGTRTIFAFLDQSRGGSLTQPEFVVLGRIGQYNDLLARAEDLLDWTRELGAFATQEFGGLKELHQAILS